MSQHFGHPHPFQLTGAFVGSQLPLPGQQMRGPHQHIAAPYNPHVPDPRHMAGSQLPLPVPQIRGPHQHIGAPYNPHVPDTRHLAGAEKYTADGRHIMTKLEYPRGEWRYQIMGVDLSNPSAVAPPASTLVDPTANGSVPAAPAPGSLAAWTHGAMSGRGLLVGAVGAVAGYFLGGGILPAALGGVAGLGVGSYWQQHGGSVIPKALQSST
jgi:hypothetical protein